VRKRSEQIIKYINVGLRLALSVALVAEISFHSHLSVALAIALIWIRSELDAWTIK
jgi:hypothetical protein